MTRRQNNTIATLMRFNTANIDWARYKIDVEKGIAELKIKNAEEVAVLTTEVEKEKSLLENVEKHVEVRRQQEALIKKNNVVMSELNQEIYKATDESVATLQAVYGEACTVQVSKRSRRNRNTANKRARAADIAAVAANE